MDIYIYDDDPAHEAITIKCNPPFIEAVNLATASECSNILPDLDMSAETAKETTLAALQALSDQYKEACYATALKGWRNDSAGQEIPGRTFYIKMECFFEGNESGSDSQHDLHY